MRPIALILLSLLAAASSVRAQEPQKPAVAMVTIRADASLRGALDDVNAVFTKATSIAVQIDDLESSAPADLVIAAGRELLDSLAAKKAIRPGPREAILGNRLVLIANAESKIAEMAIAPGVDLAKLAGDGRIAVGDAKAGLTGSLTRPALEKLGAWKAIESKAMIVESDRAALAMVVKSEAALGIVLETDARAEAGVRIVGRLPETSHPPIVYQVALTTTAKPEASRYLSFLRTGTAQVLFERRGFLYLVKAGP